MSIFPLDPRDIRLTLNGFPLYGVDDNGCEWHVTFQDVTGLFDGVASTLRTSEKVMTDGWYGNIPTYQGRTITVEGYIIGRCTEHCLMSWNSLKRVASRTNLLLTVSLGNVRRQAHVMQASSAPLVKWAGVNMLKFNLSLASLDPYLFGMDVISDSTGLPKTVGGMTFPYLFEDHALKLASKWTWNESVVSGQVTLNNPGTVPSPVSIRIDGPVVNPQVSHIGSGHVMAFNVELGVGHYILVNGQTHEILIDGTDPARGRVKRREWSRAEVGINTWGFNADAFSDRALMQVSFYPAYL